MKRFFVISLMTSFLVLGPIGSFSYARAQTPLLLNTETRALLIQLITLLQSLSVVNQQKNTVEIASTSIPTLVPIASSPHVERIVPFEGYAGSTFTIFGSGFTPVGNTVHTTYDSFPNQSSSDGKTIVFSFAIPTGEEDAISTPVPLSSEIRSIREEVKFYIENTYGKSNISSFTRRYK